MKEVYSNFYIGDENDYISKVKGKKGWSVIHACKEPYHRNALGYSGKGAPKNHPEYLIVRKEHRLILNLIDPDSPKFIPKKIIEASLTFIEKNLKMERNVLIHCNQGESRSPSIGMLYLAMKNKISNESLSKAEKDFVSLYPRYNPGRGIRKFLKQNWNTYINKEIG